jgi:hypothetical protein
VIERDAQFAGGARLVAASGEDVREIEVVVRIAGIVLNGAFEIIGGFFLSAAGRNYPEIVIDLSQRQASASGRRAATNSKARSDLSKSPEA